MDNNPVAKGLTTALYINNTLVAGGTGISLSQSSASVDISNQIEYQWTEYVSGLKTWAIQKTGFYILDEESLLLVEQAFLRGDKVKVKLKIGNRFLVGDAIIIDFPLNSTYDDNYKYIIRLQGCGALKYE